MRMPFGKYKGIEVGALPDDYIDWLIALDDLREPLRPGVFREASRRSNTVSVPSDGSIAIRLKLNDLPLAKRLFDAG